MDIEVIKLGTKGQLSVPRGMMERLGLRGGEIMIVEASEDGALVLHPAGVYPIEVYSEDRIEEFLEADRLTEREKSRISRLRGKDEGAT